jgi:hypothetical protein
MSEHESTDEKVSLEEVSELASAYRHASEEEPDQERLDDIEAEINTLQSERSEVAGNAGEDNFLTKEYDSEIQELEDEREEIRQSAEDVTQRRNDLLRAAGESPGFQFDEHWLNPDVIQTLTEALYGKKEDKLVIADHVLREPADVQEMSRSERLQVKREVMNLARDRMSGYPRIKDRWEEFEDSRAYRGFQAISRNPGVGPSEIADMYDDATNSTVRNWTSDLANQEELKMVHTPKQGNYHLSTVGKYYAAHYAESPIDDHESGDESGEQEEVEDTNTEPASESADTTDSSEDWGQQDLGNSDKHSGDQSREPAADNQSATVSSAEVENTEEKKQAMFENIGESSDSEE